MFSFLSFGLFARLLGYSFGSVVLRAQGQRSCLIEFLSSIKTRILAPGVVAPIIPISNGRTGGPNGEHITETKVEIRSRG